MSLQFLVFFSTRKRTPTPYSGASDYSRSSTPDSFRLPSESSTLSRSHSPSGSSYSDSPSRSRSRSPIATHHSSHRSKKHRSRRHKHEKVRHEKLREKGKERKSGHHHSSSRKKRKRHLSPEIEERLSKSHHPDRKKHRDNITLSALVEDDLLSPASSLPSGALSPEMELESQGILSSLTHRKHHHKKRSKAKRSRQRKRSEKEMDVDLLARLGDLPADYPGDQGIQPTESVVKDAGSAEKIELAENEGESIEDRAVTGGDDVTMAKADGARSKSSASLVPYQDSSTTETEGREQGEGEEHTHGAAAGGDGDVQDDRPGASPSDSSKERLASSTSSAGSSGSLDGDREVNDAIEELEAAMKEGVTAADGDDDSGDRPKSDDGNKASGKEEETGNVKGDDVAVDEGAPPTSSAAVEGEGEEGEEIAEDSLMIAVHVDEDDIDQDSAELLDAECPNKGIPLPRYSTLVWHNLPIIMSMHFVVETCVNAAIDNCCTLHFSCR